MRIFKYKEDETKEMINLKYHEDSVRRIDFSPDGNILYTASTDRSIGVISNGKLEGRLTDCHPSPINSIMHIDN